MGQNLIEATHLGKNVDYPQNYKPEVLVAVPRKLNREIYKIDENNLPFVGYDAWHAYEISFLTKKGLPVVGLIKLVYSSSSQFLVESKSLKLYLNSFNMEKFGNSQKEGIELVISIIKNDLEKLLKTEVNISFYSHNSKEDKSDFDNYEILEESQSVENIEFSFFSEDKSLIKTENKVGEIKIGSHLLRSNCKITNQPDWGSLFIHLEGDKIPTKESLLKYIISIRNENHFHEEICELIYIRLWEICSPKNLTVSCLYTRRGGIDICPTRSNNIDNLPPSQIDHKSLTHKLLRQ
mgnify:CR=1 FL=1